MIDLSDVHLGFFMTEGMSLDAWNRGGMLARELALYRRLSEDLAEVALVSYGGREDLRYAAELDGVRPVINRWRLPKPIYVATLPLQLRRLRSGVSVCKTNQIPGADVALATARRTRSRFVARCGYLFSFTMEKRHGETSSAARAARKLESEVFNAADRIVVTTNAIRTRVCESYDVDPTRVAVIPNYVETDRFSPRESPSVGDVCFVGRLEPVKNCPMLIEALAGTGLRLVVVGDGPLRPDLEALARVRGVPTRFLGTVPNTELPRIVNGCPIFVLPSSYEGHPKVLIEAMSCGRAVVGTRVPGIEDVVGHGADGLLVNVDRDDLREAITDLAGDPELRSRLGRTARETALDSYSLERIASLELSLLREVVA